MTQHVAHRKSDEKTEYDCCECGGHVVGCVPSPIHPYCGPCVWCPGWWRDPELRKQFAHDEQWRNELALRAELEAAGSPFCKFNKNYANPIFAAHRRRTGEA